MTDPQVAVKYRSLASSGITTDDYELANEPERIDLTLMAADRVDTSTPGQLRLAGPERELLVDYDADQWDVATERIEIDDARMSPVWGAFVTRIVLTMKAPTREGRATLSIHA